MIYCLSASSTKSEICMKEVYGEEFLKGKPREDLQYLHKHQKLFCSAKLSN